MSSWKRHWFNSFLKLCQLHNPALPPRHPTTDWAEYASIQSSCLHKSPHKRPGLANLLHPWHLHAPFPTNLDPRGPLWLEKRGSKVAAAISLFVYLDLRWRQGLWRAHHHHHRSGQAGSSPHLNQDWSSSRQRSGLRHICLLFSKNLTEPVDMAGFIFCTINISFS